MKMEIVQAVIPLY